MSDLKRIQKFDSQETGFLFDFNGEMTYLTNDEVETHLKKYFKIREQMKKEKQIRKAHEPVNDAWEMYQAILLLYKKHDK